MQVSLIWSHKYITHKDVSDDIGPHHYSQVKSNIKTSFTIILAALWSMNPITLCLISSRKAFYFLVLDKTLLKLYMYGIVAIVVVKLHYFAI